MSNEIVRSTETVPPESGRARGRSATPFKAGTASYSDSDRLAKRVIF